MFGLRKAFKAAVAQTKDGFLSLRGSHRDLYLIFALKVLESYNYFSLSRSMTLYLTEEFGIDDYRAGTLYGLWGTLLTAYGFLLGGMIDYLGVKLSLLLCFVLNIGSRLVMASTASSWVMLVMLLGPNTMAGALGVPVMTIGVKRFTNEANRGFAFSLFYSFMNVAALLQGMLMDVFRIGLRHGFDVPGLGEHSLLNSGFRLFLASGCVTSLVGLCLTFFLSGSFAPVAYQPPHPQPLQKRKHSDTLACAAGQDVCEGEGREASPGEPLMLELDSTAAGPEDGFEQSGPPPSRVVSVEEALLNRGQRSNLGEGVVRRAGGHPHTVHGTGGDREEAEEGSGRGGAEEGGGSEETPSKGRKAFSGRVGGGLASALESIKAVLASRGFWKYMAMCVFTVNLKSIFRHLDATLPKYQLRAFGCETPIGLIYSINPAMIVLLVPLVGAMTTEYSPFDMIHLGGYLSALSPFWMVAFNTEWSTAAFVALLSLGEAVWSPRWYDYSMSVAPEGREGVFTALASAPLFAAMLPTGMISGYLLQTYCPENGQCAQNGGASGGGSVRRLFEAAAAVHTVGDDPGPAVSECDGRVLWLIIGCITLSSPLLILLTQRWIRPNPQDFAKVGLPTHRGYNEGEQFDVNDADPTAVVENVYQARREVGVVGAQEDAERRPLL